MKGNTQLRQESLKRVLTEIRERGPISKRELQALTGFSWGNMSSIITLLCDSGYIVSAGKQDTGIGRKPDGFDINTEDNYIIGVDFNTAGILAAVCDLKGRIIASFNEEFEKKDRETAEASLYKAVSKAVRFCKGKKVTYIAVAMQGDVDAENGVSVCLSEISGWKNIPVCEMLGKKFGKKAVMLHDPDCLLYAERFYGALKGTDIRNAAEIRIDHGLGLAVLLDGRIYMGNKGRTCEIKDIIVPSANEKGFSYLGDVIGSTNIVRAKFEKATGMKKRVNEIADLARAGDERAIAIFDEMTTALAFSVNNLVSLYNCEKIIIFGEFKNNADLFLDKLINQSKELLVCSNIPKIVISPLEETAAAVGAALFAADSLVEQLYFEKK